MVTMAKSLHHTAGQPVVRLENSNMAAPGPESKELPIEFVRFSISADELQELDNGSDNFDIIGQPRALRALRMAVEMQSKGYNIFVTGMPGTGKRTAILKILEEYRTDISRLRDVAYVFNFLQPDRPRALYFQPGTARTFRSRLQELIDVARRALQDLSDNQRFKEQRDHLVIQAEGKENQTLRDFEGRLDSAGFRIVEVNEEEEQRTDIAPVWGGEPTSFEALQKRVTSGEIDESEWNRTRERYYKFMDEMNQMFQRLRSRRDAVARDLNDLRVRIIKPTMEREISRMAEEFPDEHVREYLNEFQQDVLSHLDWFSSDDEDKEEAITAHLERYDVNILVDHSRTEKRPVVFESHPDYQKLFGAQETVYEPGGEMKGGFMMLRAGSLVQASGGYLILRAENILMQDDIWNALKRALQDGVQEIRNTPTPFGAQAGSLKPEPIRVDVKVIVMGSEHLYDFLYDQDEEFGKLFKVPAEFDSLMPRNDHSMHEYMSFIRMICLDEHLLSLTYDGMAAVMEFGVRLCEFRNKISTRFSFVADVIRESDYWARKDKKKEIDRPSVERALRERQYLYDLPEEKIDEQILSGELLISVTDKAVGRINGLAIVDRGYYAFARPVLITARSAPGDAGIVNIEREAGLSGEIHDKGIYILEGFLQSRYARDFPLSIHASICFEQSYVEVDGDSASSTEVYVLLSAIAEVALRQDIAVTGSVNQMGEIQPVGGISEKVEGFYAICEKTGITGSQGVIIPRQNIPNLILSKRVQDAVAAGAFHIYSIQSINEGLEILTGMEAGGRTQKGRFKTGTVNALVEKRLREMAQQMKSFGSS